MSFGRSEKILLTRIAVVIWWRLNSPLVAAAFDAREEVGGSANQDGRISVLSECASQMRSPDPTTMISMELRRNYDAAR